MDHYEKFKLFAALLYHCNDLVMDTLIIRSVYEETFLFSLGVYSIINQCIELILLGRAILFKRSFDFGNSVDDELLRKADSMNLFYETLIFCIIIGFGDDKSFEQTVTLTTSILSGLYGIKHSCCPELNVGTFLISFYAVLMPSVILLGFENTFLILFYSLGTSVCALLSLRPDYCTWNFIDVFTVLFPGFYFILAA